MRYAVVQVTLKKFWYCVRICQARQVLNEHAAKGWNFTQFRRRLRTARLHEDRIQAALVFERDTSAIITDWMSKVARAWIRDGRSYCSFTARRGHT